MSEFIRSSIGKKYLMGITGLVWAGFIFAHMAGNMLILVDPNLYNAYGHNIVSNKPLLYGTEVVLLLALIVHVFCAINLTLANRKSRGVKYKACAKGGKAPNFGSNWMFTQGSVILLFIITHLTTFKYGTHYETTVNGVVMRDLAKLIDEVFHQPGYVAWYLVSLILLGIHVRHGIGSLFQSFGLLHPGYQTAIRRAGVTYAFVVALGFISQPLYVFLIR